MKKNYLILLLLLFSVTLSIKSQTSNDLWSATSELNKKGSNKIKNTAEPLEFKLFDLNYDLLLSKLNTASKQSSKKKEKGTIVTFPNELGELKEYEVFEASIMSEGLQNKFPNLKSYIGKGVENPSLLIRFSITNQGLNALILNNSTGSIYIEPYLKDKKSYIIYSNKSLPKTELFECGVENGEDDRLRKTKINLKNSNDSYLRTFRLAVTTTAEYSQWHLTNQGINPNSSEQIKKEAVLSAVVSTVTAVNAIFERDIALTMILVENSENIIFLDPKTDNMDKDTDNFINEGQYVIDDNIGYFNYDIGHVFSYDDEYDRKSGAAYLNSFCTKDKAKGYTKMYNPIGNKFNSTVIHELGHQYGANHTFNNSCTFNRNDVTAIEPGSGSTIMSYAGICDPNVQENVDMYFNFINIQEIWNNISSDSSCGELKLINNVAPSLNEISDFIIPILTPFVLNVNASDPDNDEMTYNWEQFDNEIVGSPPTSSANSGPLFRSLPPSVLSQRYFPNQRTVNSGNVSNTWEVLPSVGRTMKFSVTVRDNNIFGGQTTSKESLITVDSSSGPFQITSQTISESWEVGALKTINWDVANTNNSVINCLNVNILMSLDGGGSYPITLASNVVNNGFYEIVVPNVTSNGGRIKVESVGNVFYAISTGYISINYFENKTFVPDDNFEQALIDLGYDNALDNQVLTSSINGIADLNVGGYNIINLKGIENFSSLSTFNCKNNKLISLDLSFNENLTNLDCSSNQLLTLKLAANSLLEQLVCSDNQLSDLAISNNISLTKLDCSKNELTNLDISLNNNLSHFSSTENLLNCITISEFQLGVIDINWEKDNTANYSLDCTNVNNQLTYIPDDNFEQALINLGFDEKLDNFILTSTAENIGVLEIKNKNISNLEGIQDFINIQVLDISNNNLTELYISENTELVNLYCGNNQLSNLNISENIKLVTLFCFNNSLASLSVSSNIALESLVCFENGLTNLDLSKSPNLVVLQCDVNKLTSLDFTNNTNLWLLECRGNNLVNIDVSNCPKLNELYCSWNSLNNLNISYNTKLEILECESTKLKSLDLSHNTNLEILSCDNNEITAIDLSNNPNLVSLNCSGTLIESLNLSNNLILNQLYCMDNQLVNLNVSNNKHLDLLNCSGNKLKELDISGNIRLADLRCSWNELSSLNISNAYALEILNTTNNPLDCIQVSRNQIIDIPLAWSKDKTSKYAIDCSGTYTYIPDDNFEQILIDLNLDDVLDDLVLTENIQSLQELDVSNRDISTLLGIEDFLDLTNLNCSNNKIFDIDINSNQNLKFLDCHSNSIESLDIQENILLENLNFSENDIVGIDLSNNILLKDLSCSNNLLYSLDLSSIIDLENFSSQNNLISCIQLNNEQLNNIPDSWIKDDFAVYSIDCSALNGERTYIPDDNFEQYLINLGLDYVLDDYVYSKNIEDVIDLDISNKNIGSLEGIEGFVGLKRLISQSNHFTTINISKNIELEEFKFIYEPIEQLDVSNNINLKKIVLAYNKLNNLDLSNNKMLEEIGISGTQINYIDVTNCTDLSYISFYMTPITQIDISKNLELERFMVSYGNLNYIDISKNINLKVLRVSNNNLMSLDLSNNFYLEDIVTNNNPNLTCIQVNKGQLNNIPINWTPNENVEYSLVCPELLDDDKDGVLNTVDACPNTPTGEDVNENGCALSQLDDDGDGVLNNTDLCPNTPTGEDVNENGCSQSQIDDDGDGVVNNVDICSNTPSGEIVDENGCSATQSPEKTFVPDDNFEQILIDLGLDDQLDDYVRSGKIKNITELKISNKNINSLIGIEDFKSLEILHCYNNHISEIDISNNLRLKELAIDNNILEALDISANINLEHLQAENNKIILIDVSNNIKLERLYLGSNQFTDINLSNNIKLQALILSYNNLYNLDLSQNPELVYLVLYFTKLFSLDVSKNQKLQYLYAENITNLNCIQVSEQQLTQIPIDWHKNDSTEYLINCPEILDDDNDGAMNDVDTCPNTPTGENVNATGCSQSQIDDDSDGVMNNLDLCPNTTAGTDVNENGCFFLPSNNFSIEVISETCPDKNNGELKIMANETHSYVATINGTSYNFNNNSLTVPNLTPDTYIVCLSVTGEIFEQCYTIVIAEGKTISGKTSVTSNKASIAIEQGTAPYNLYVNGINVLNTLASSFTIDVKHGDLLEVKTAKSCEGVFLKAIDLFENITVYPNPSKEIFEITLPISEKEVVIELYTMGSQLISKETYQVVNGKVQINLENRPTGVYVVKINLNTPVNLTIIKE